LLVLEARNSVVHMISPSAIFKKSYGTFDCLFYSSLSGPLSTENSQENFTEHIISRAKCRKLECVKRLGCKSIEYILLKDRVSEIDLIRSD